MLWLQRCLACVLALLTVSACQVNPVTGQRHFQLYGEDWEAQVGDSMYAPLKQSQGADWIMDPELTAYVQEVGEKLARQARRNEVFDYEFSVLNNSTPNAWALPGGKIVINRGLLTEMDSEAELAAVLAHEIVHSDAAHGARQQSSGALVQIGAMVSMVVLSNEAESPVARGIALLVPQVGMQLIMQRYSRDAEREADRYGMMYMAEAGYNPQGAVDLQETFLAISSEQRQDWLSGLFASHPPSRERVSLNRATADELGRTGIVGVDRYRQKTRYLRQVRPAYDAFDRAGEALAKDDVSTARSELSKALREIPNEALFLATRGDIERREGKQAQALRSYREAVKANPNLFYGHLRQGAMEFERGRFDAARSSLERSLELLPTADAHYLLGRVAQRAGRTEQAIAHFREASGSPSEAGRKAREALLQSELATNAARYIQAQGVQDRDGRIWVQLGNRTDVALEDIQLTVAWLDQQGQVQRTQVRFRGPLPANSTDRMPLRLKLPLVQNLDLFFRAQAVSARVAR